MKESTKTTEQEKKLSTQQTKSKSEERKQYNRNCSEEEQDETGLWIGMSEEGARIYKGDYLICKKVFETKEEAELYLDGADGTQWDMIQAIAYGMAMGAIMTRERELREQMKKGWEELSKEYEEEINNQKTKK